MKGKEGGRNRYAVAAAAAIAAAAAATTTAAAAATADISSAAEFACGWRKPRKAGGQPAVKR